MRCRLIALCLLLASTAVAQVDVTNSPLMCVQEDSVTAGWVRVFDFDDAQFDTSVTASSAGISLNSSVTQLGATLEENELPATSTFTDDDETITATWTFSDGIVLSNDTETALTLTGGTLVVPNSAAPAQTTEASLAWDTTNKRLTVGSASATKPYYKGGMLLCSGTTDLPFSTTVSYGAWPAPYSAVSSTTESQRQTDIPSALVCDSISACAVVAAGANEAVTIKVRDDGADTTLACTIDGNSGTSTCTGASTQKGCRATVSPVTIAANSLTDLSFVCAGAGCPTSGFVIPFVCVHCWEP